MNEVPSAAPVIGPGDPTLAQRSSEPTGPPPSVDAAPSASRWHQVLERAAAMGLDLSIDGVDTTNWVSAVDLFPWWMLEVLDGERADSRQWHLGKLLVSRRYNISVGESEHRLAWQTFTACLPVGSRDEVRQMLLEIVRECAAFGEGVSDRPAVAALCGLAHLRRTEPGGSQGRDAFEEAVWALVPGKLEHMDALRAACRLTAESGIRSLVGAIVEIARKEVPALMLDACGCLARLGPEGAAALQALPGQVGAKVSTLVQALIDAWERHDFDGLDPSFNSEQWHVRGAAARFLSDLVVAGGPGGPALEILLARFRVEEDCDVKTLLAESLGEVLHRCGSGGAGRVLTLIQELGGEGNSQHLLDALTFSGQPGVPAEQLESLRPLFEKGDRYGAAALNRCLAFQEGVRPSVLDWIHVPVVKALQWSRIRLPASVAGWFTSTPDIEGHQVTAAILREVELEHAGNLAAQFLRHHPELVHVWERLACLYLNSGTPAVWSLLASALAGTPHAVSMHPAELRCALGASCAPAPRFSWSAVGRLVAVAASPVSHARDAIRLLGSMGPEARELARHALGTIPSGRTSLTGMAALPPPVGIGPSQAPPGSLGTMASRAPGPGAFPLEFQPMFSLRPRAFTQGARAIDGLVVGALHWAEWGADLMSWQDATKTSAVVEEAPIERVQQAIVACGMSGRPGLVRLIRNLGQAAGPACRQGGLGPLVGVLVDRVMAEPEATPEPQPKPASPSTPSRVDSSDDVIDMDDFLRSLNEE